MLNTALVVAIAGAGVAQTYPDQVGLFRGADTTPQIELVVDTSGSMGLGWGTFQTNCNYYYQTVLGNGANALNPLTKTEMLKAALTGCQTANDGVLDTWDRRVLFSIREFGGARTGLLTNFDPTLSNHNALETAILGLQASGGTPMAEAYGLAGAHISSFFNNTNSRECRQSYVVLMTDGEGNGALPGVFNFVTGQPAVSAVDAFNCFPAGCGAPILPPFSDAGSRYMVQDALGNLVDAVPNVTGSQQIRTYTIAFQAPANAQNLLMAMAAAGDGTYYDAVSYTQLNNAFTDIILSIVARANVSFSPGSIQNDGLFSGNYIYQTSFRPVEDGYWHGGSKKYCVLPNGLGDTTCIFVHDPGNPGQYLTNTQPFDWWSGSRSQNATVGGTGHQMLTAQFGLSAVQAADPPAAPIPANPLTRRNIFTWRTGTAGYTRVDGTNLTSADTWTANTCEHRRLLNKLHGFTHEADCAGGTYAPLAFDEWPIGDTINGDTVLLKYTRNCETAGDRCYVATVSNDGMIHFYNALNGNGIETSAIIPGEFWQPNNVSKHLMSQIMDQPTLTRQRRFYMDGGLRLYHDDTDADGVIDPTEVAYLVAAAGRGGRAMYQLNVTNFNGTPTDASNPPRPLVVDQSTGFSNLRETWSPPWMGRYRHSDNRLYRTAAFASGHEENLDQPAVPFAQLQPGLPIPSGDTTGTPRSVPCTNIIEPDLCNPPLPATGCTPCMNPDPLLCPLGTGGLIGFPEFYCYDWPGWSGITLPPPLNTIPFTLGSPTGINWLFGPYSWSSAGQTAIAFQVSFSRFDLQPGDYVAVYDSNLNEVGRLTGPQGGAPSLPWVNDTSFYLRLRTDGNDTASSRGFAMNPISILRNNAGPSPTLSRPEVYLVDLDRWNGTGASATQNFAAIPGAGDMRQSQGLLARITSDCAGLSGPIENCIDAAGNGGLPAQPDLRFMTCPLSAEMAVYEEGGVFRTAFIGDECGQIWAMDLDPSGIWTVNRILTLNNRGALGETIAGRQSKDYRKIFTQLELVLSTCNGSRAIGVYFGTGNLQRPAEFDNLQDPTVTGGLPNLFTPDANVMGVVWYSPSVPTDKTLVDLRNVSLVGEILDTRTGPARNGFFIELGLQEKMLRDPLVFDGVAYFRTYQPIVPATECISAEGIDRVYAFNNCTSRPIVDPNGNGIPEYGERQVWSGATDIGGNLLLFTPKDQNAFVSVGDLSSQQAAALPSAQNRRQMRIFLWRTTVDPIF